MTCDVQRTVGLSCFPEVGEEQDIDSGGKK